MLMFAVKWLWYFFLFDYLEGIFCPLLSSQGAIFYWPVNWSHEYQRQNRKSKLAKLAFYLHMDG